MNASIVKEIQELVSANVISQETADKIVAYYRNKTTDTNKFTVILSILGACLIGSGIILVIAHNWDGFSRPVKTFFAFLPLAISQLLCLYVILKKKGSVAWGEASATLLFFSVGACISLISQIYHISGSLSSFLFNWMILIVPLVYLLSSYLVALLYISGITWYACMVGYDYGYYADNIPYWYLILLAVLVPFYIKMRRRNPGGNAIRVFNWFVAISFACCFGGFGSFRNNSEMLLIGYVGLFSFYYIIGANDRSPEGKINTNSFLLIGLAGVLTILYIWSFNAVWESASIDTLLNAFFEFPFNYITVLIYSIMVYMAAIRFRHSGWGGFDPVGFSAFVITSTLLLFHNFATIGTLITNLWLLLLGLYYIRKGSQRMHFGILNFGLFIMTVLALLRFFDDSIPFVWRGILFLLTGAGIFAANFILLKKKKAIVSNHAP